MYSSDLLGPKFLSLFMEGFSIVGKHNGITFTAAAVQNATTECLSNQFD